VSIESPRLIFRDFQEGDLDGCMSIVGDPEVTTFLSFDTRTRDEHTEKLTADIERAQAQPRPDYYLYSLLEQEWIPVTPGRPS
jgi:ribosomal-protein-alanine N-acetyltransferase